MTGNVLAANNCMPSRRAVSQNYNITSQCA